MSGFLFQQFVFGPILSRRLGRSLGINLLPVNQKLCNFNCLYCECGWTTQNENKLVLPSRKEIYTKLEAKLVQMRDHKQSFDVITFAGNGEPTLHPEFAEVIDDTILLRDKYYPEAKISVLSNATTCHKPHIAQALHKVDLNILKLDAGTSETFEIINCQSGKIKFDKILDNLALFKGKMIIQTLFLKGISNNIPFDNTTPQEVNSWLNILKELQPTLVMIYSVARETPLENVEKIPQEKLQEIAQKVLDLGLNAEVF